MLERLAPRPRGRPDRPLLEAILLFGALWLGAYLPSGAAAGAPAALGEPLSLIGNAGAYLARTLFLLYFMASSEGLAAFGLGPLRSRDFPWAFLAAAGAACIALLPNLAAAAIEAIGRAGRAGGQLSNPLLDAVARPSASPLLVIPLLLLFALAVGYGEELFFRVYLVERLEGGGLSAFWAAALSSLLFGGAHGAQGWLGVLLGTALGAWFSWLWAKRRNLHEIALGHFLYDAAVLLVALYAR